ncbi:MAG TPA: hypothetical protein VH062_13550 [Polyangiaceae bacterium]|nr:hypothetical protein [Polyangiaceae bacterium]
MLDAYGEPAVPEDVMAAHRNHRNHPLGYKLVENAYEARSVVEDKALRRTSSLGSLRHHDDMSLGDLVLEIAGHGMISATEGVARSTLKAMATELDNAADALDAYVRGIQSDGVEHGVRPASETMHKIARQARAFAELDSRVCYSERRAQKAGVTS